MAVTGNTQLAPTKMDLILATALRELKFSSKLMPYVSDVSAFAEKGVKSIKFPKFTTSFTVEKRLTTASATVQDLTTAIDTLDLNQNAIVAWEIDAMDALQSRIDVELEYVKRAASAHGRQVDLDLFTEAATVSSLVIPSAAITRDDILAMQSQLLKVLDPEQFNQAALFVSIAQREALLKISEFTQAQIYGSAVIPSGVVGSVYGIPVVLHRGLTGTAAFMWHKEGLAWGAQASPNYAEQADILKGTNTKIKAVDQLYGQKGLHLGLEGAAAGKSPLVCSIAAA